MNYRGNVIAVSSISQDNGVVRVYEYNGTHQNGNSVELDDISFDTTYDTFMDISHSCTRLQKAAETDCTFGYSLALDGIGDRL